jgi:nucleoside 2-deoxyribosyltransferase
MSKTEPLLIAGEISVDYTLAKPGALPKLRLGGVVHAARGLWSAGIEYAIAGFCPQYLVGEVQKYLSACGCNAFHWLGNVVGAPNIILIGDASEVTHQGYEDLMRETRSIELCDPPPRLDTYRNVLAFPGRYDLSALAAALSPDATVSFDIAYDIADVRALEAFSGRIGAIMISTSSPLFTRLGKDDVSGILDEVKTLSPEAFLLKENRGGSRVFTLDGGIYEVPAILGKTVNSVGVGDVYSAVMVGLSDRGWNEAAWRGCQAATAYSQSTFPDDIKLDVSRAFNLPLETLQALGGIALPWHERRDYSIYLAGPDFSYVEKEELDRAADSLSYHNFNVQRPVQINGELKRPANADDLRRTYALDRDLLERCDLVFAVPLGRDPGTLVEIGLALGIGKPVITYDPRRENGNTMVIGGSEIYSDDLDTCLNGTFSAISTMRSNRD